MSAIGRNQRIRPPRPVVIGAVVLAAACLQGCGLSSLTSGFGGVAIGGSQSTGSVAPSVTEESLLTAAKSEGESAPNVAAGNLGCPQIFVWTREKHLTIYEAGRTGDGLAIIHQGEITKVARDCQFEGEQVTIKYGFSGRVLLGPKGQPGLVDLPAQMFVTGPDGERVASSSLRVSVAISPDNPIGYFSTVKLTTFKVPEGQRPADYKIFVGFEKTAGSPQANEVSDKPTKGRKKI